MGSGYGFGGENTEIGAYKQALAKKRGTCENVDKGETCLVGYTTGWTGWDCARAANQAADSDGTNYCTSDKLAGDGTAMKSHMADCCPATCGVCSGPRCDIFYRISWNKPSSRRRVYKTRRLYAIRDVPTFCIGTVIAMWEILEEDKSPWSQNYCE